MQLPPSSIDSAPRKRHPFRLLFPYVILFAWIGLLAFATVHKQDAMDWWKLRHYQPPGEIVLLANKNTMTDYGRKLFYVNGPQLEQKTTFASSCPNNGGEQTIVLGCYHGGQNGIFLLRVTDPRLSGVQQVTAAHETLHAGYERLGSKEKVRVDGMLQDYYDNGLKDQRIKDVIAAYRKSEPNDVVNEMHSIFGTEVSDLPPTLETYYTKYFANRRQIAGYAAQYQAEFTSRQATIAADDAKLNDLKAQIESAEADLKTKEAQINTQQATLNSLRSSNVSAYNAAVPGYNNLVDSYNAQVASVRELISQFNDLVATRNAVAVEQDQLVKELSNDATPISNN